MATVTTEAMTVRENPLSPPNKYPVGVEPDADIEMNGNDEIEEIDMSLVDLSPCAPMSPDIVIDEEELPELPVSLEVLDLIEEAKRSGNLDLTGMKLTQIPKAVFKLGAGLVSLSLNMNELNVLPRGLLELTELEELSMRDNNIKIVPDWICELKELRSLDLCLNRLTKLPVEIGKCHDDLELKIHEMPGNCEAYFTPPACVVAMGIPAIRNYFSNLKEYKEDQEAKKEKPSRWAGNHVGESSEIGECVVC